jgi:hypothetical protein
MEQNSNNGIPLKTRQQVADEYFDTTIKVLNGAIERHKLNIPHGGALFPKHQKLIYEALGYPLGVNPKNYENV